MIHPRLVHACTDPALLAALAKVAKAQQLKAYLGVDPTARSLHVGHLVGVQAMRQLQQLGFGSVGLVGGATALIGDPSFRDKAREPLSADACAANAARLGAQLQDLLGRECVMVDNAEWFREMSAVDLLRDVGSHFKVHAMLSRDAVKARREGLNFTELAYQMLQAYDFSVLHARLGVRVQVGGSDQWGNIVGGVELIHRLHASSASSPREPPRAQLQPLADAAVGLTVPLVTVGKDRQKLGKSAGNAVWLDPGMTSDFAFYQYFMRLEDGDAASMLPLLSEDPDPDAGVSAQQTLARRVTRSVRGPEAVRRAEALTSLLYGHTSGAGFSPADVLAAAREADAPPTPVAAHSSASAAACKAGLCASNNEARRLELAGGLYVNGERAEAGRVLRAEDFSQGVALLRAGKARWAVLRLADG